MRTIILIGIGGFIGGIARYLMASFFTKLIPSVFPYGTFVVNISGCFLIGIFYALSERYKWLSPELRIFLTTGLCGGFTTFSSLMFEDITLLQASDYITALLYIITSIVLGLLAVFSGNFLIKII